MSKLQKVSIIVIGNEILSGRTIDKNVNFIAKRCDKIGLNLFEVRIIPDEKLVIKDTVLELSKKSDYVFTTGGIGPTHDDITTESIGLAFGRKLEINSEAVKRMKSPEGEIADVLEIIQGRYEEVTIGSYPFFRPPDIGSIIVLRSLNKNKIQQAFIELLEEFQNAKILYEFD